MTSPLSNIPYLGAGIGLRDEIVDKTLLYKNEIDVLEIISELYFFENEKERAAEWLKKFNSVFPIIPHGVKLSIGSAYTIDKNFLAEMRELCNFIKAPYYSDHFALTRHPGGIDLGHLSPIWFTKELLEIVVEKVDQIQQFLGIPLVLENITSLFDIKEADFEEPEFISEVCRRTGCGLLLDLTNIHINSYNRGINPQMLLERFPMDHVVQIHLAGGVISHGHYSDTHSEELNGANEGVWPLLEWTSKHADIKAVIIERDSNFKTDFEEMILKDIRRARAILDSSRN